MTPASKEPQTPTEPIYHASRMCSDLFDECIDEMNSSSESYLIVEELRGRFRRWAAYVGAFAVPKASLDARLVSQETMKEMVLDLIYMLQQNLRWAKSERSNEIVKSKRPDEENPEAFVGISAVESAIDRLFVLAVALRRSARWTHYLRPGSEGRDSKTLCSLLLQTKYPNARKSLHSQLIHSIYTRGISLQYLQLHNRKLAYQRESDTVFNQSVESGKEQAENTTKQTRIEVHPKSAVQMAPSAPETHPPIVSPSDVVRYHQGRKKPSSSIIRTGSMVRDAKDEEFLYPSMPKQPGDTSYISCPICSDPLKTSTLTEEVWREHIDEDLEPFVCISEECGEPLQYFIYLQDWENHMHTRHTINWAQRIHTEKWYCDFGHTNSQEFDEKDEFLNHLTTQHGQQLTTSQLQGRLRRNRRIAKRDPFVCPICDCVPDDLRPRIAENPYKLLSKHIGQHLKSLSFLSLSYLNADFRYCESTDEYFSRSQSRILNSSFASLSGREHDSFDDIPLTEIFDNGTRRTDGQEFADDPRPMSKSEHWEFIPPKDLATDYEQLRQKLTSLREDLKPETISNNEYLLSSAGLRLLSLDGGGVRGLSTLYVLKILMAQLNFQRQKTGFVQVKPCEVFDLIGGASTGGLIAIMIGRLEMDVDECITAYNNIIKMVLVEKPSSPPVSLKGITKPQFDSAILDRAIKEMITSRGLSEQSLLNDDVKRSCRVFVCATSYETNAIKRLRSYTPLDEPGIPATIHEAARATLATTTFFDTAHIGTHTFVDSALGANNPVYEVEAEASSIWCSEMADLQRQVKCFVSIGTGNPGEKVIEDKTIKLFSKTLVNLAAETARTADEFVSRGQHHFDMNRYFRFNVLQGLQNVRLAEYKNQHIVKAATEEYFTPQEQQSRLRECVSTLKQNQKQNSYEACWSIPFARNPQFVGRHTQLEQLEDTIFSKDQTQIIAITGLGGIGKSQIALELAYRTRERNPECSVFWIPATNAEILQQAFIAIAQQLEIPVLKMGQNDVKNRVQHHLTQNSTSQWLLIVDNISDIDIWNNELRDFLPLPKSQQGCIVCTTRSRRVAVKIAAANVIEVREMDEKMAMQLLTMSLLDQELSDHHQVVRRLLEQLTFLPLAIVQAAAFINESKMALSEYLSLLYEEEHIVMKLLIRKSQDVQKTVATTWQTSFEQIQQLDPLAAEYLSFMSCVDPKGIPQLLLPPGPSRTKEIDALRTLYDYSFVSKRAADNILDVHQLVHLAMRNWLRRKNSLAMWTARAIKRLEEVFPNNDNKNRSVWRLYLAHARYVLKGGKTEDSAKESIELARKFALCLYSDGRYNETEQWLFQVMETYKRVLGAEHLDTLTSIDNLASTYRYQGRWQEAEELHVQVMETRIRVLGVEHLDTLTSMANLASTYWNQGRWKAAEELDVQAMETRIRVLGEEHPDTLTSVANLASTYGNQGRWQEAEELHVQAMETRIKVLGEEHPDTLTSVANLASMYRNQGRWKVAEELDVKAMETRIRVLGEEHPDTLTSMANLASTYWNQGRWKDAEELDVKAIEIRKRVLGEEHPDTLTSIANLASTYGNQGRWQEAEELDVQAMETRTRVLGEEHPDTLTSIANLASTYGNQGRWKEAEELHVQAMETRIKVLGAKHPDTLISMANLALTFKSQGRKGEAILLLQKCFELRKKVLGPQHPHTLSLQEALVREHGDRRLKTPSDTTQRSVWY